MSASTSKNEQMPTEDKQKSLTNEAQVLSPKTTIGSSEAVQSTVLEYKNALARRPEHPYASKLLSHLRQNNLSEPSR